MEDKAKYHEVGIRHKKPEEAHEINQLYLDSLKAKMALLE